MTTPIVLTQRGWTYLVVALAVGASWFLIGVRGVWYLAAFLSALLLLSLVFALVLPRAARFEVRLSATDPTPVAGTAVTLTALVRHRSPFPLRAQVLWRTEDGLRATPLAIVPQAAATAELDWIAGGRGPIPVRVPGILVLDPLGLVARNTRIAARTELLVLPRTLDALDVRLGETGSTRAGASAGDRISGIDAGTPAGSVRAYRSGDPLRQIHWKQSARQGELLVNLDETVGRAHRTLLLLHRADAFASPAEFELAVSAAATLATRWLREGHPIRLHLDTDRSQLCSSETEMLRLLSRSRLGGTADPASLSVLAPAPQAVITGTLNDGLVRELARIPSGGLLLARRRTSDARPPSQWQSIEIPGRPPTEIVVGRIAGGSRNG